MELKKDHEYRLRNDIIVRWLGANNVLVLSVPPKSDHEYWRNQDGWKIKEIYCLPQGEGVAWGRDYDIVKEVKGEKDWRGILKDVSDKLKADDFEFVDKLMSFLVLAYQKSNEEQKLKVREIIKNKISVLELMRDA